MGLLLSDSRPGPRSRLKLSNPNFRQREKEVFNINIRDTQNINMSTQEAQKILNKLGVKGFGGIMALIAGFLILGLERWQIALGVFLVILGIVLVALRIASLMLEMFGMDPSSLF